MMRSLSVFPTGIRTWRRPLSMTSTQSMKVLCPIPRKIGAIERVPFRETDLEVEYKKLWQLYNRKMFKSIKTRIPKEEQRTVRVAVIGRESSGKSSLINGLLGRKACPVASVPGSTANARIHTMTLGNTLFEFCDVPGVNDIITPDGIGENTFRPDNIKRAKKDHFGDVRKAQQPQPSFAVNDIFIKNADVVIVCADTSLNMTKMGNLTPDVYHLLKRNPHVPSILALTKTDLMTVRHNRHFKKFDQKHLRAKTVMDIIDKITEGHVKGVQYKDMQLRGRENLIEMKPLTVKVEETGLEMRRPMRVRRMSTVKQMESILRLVHSWRWDELNKYQQDLIEMGNRGYRYFECVHPVSSEQPQTLGPLFDSISQFAVRRPWNIEDALSSSPSIPELFESNIQDAISDTSYLNFHQGRDKTSSKYEYGGAMAVYNKPTRMELEHVEVNGDKPSNAEIRCIVKAQYDPKKLIVRRRSTVLAMGEELFNMTYQDKRKFKLGMAQANKDLFRNKRHNQALAERRLMQVFGVSRVKVEIIVPEGREFNPVVYDSLHSKSMGKSYDRQSNAEKAKIDEYIERGTYLRASERASSAFEDPNTFYKDDHDLYFLDDQTKAQRLRFLGKEHLKDKRLLKFVRDNRPTEGGYKFLPKQKE